jgi:hypothetical protein
MHKILLMLVLSITFPLSSYAESENDVISKVMLLNETSLKLVGVSLAALSYLAETGPYSFRPTSYLEETGKIALIKELEEAGYISTSERTGLPDGQEPNEKFLVVVPTESGLLIIASIDTKGYNN